MRGVWAQKSDEHKQGRRHAHKVRRPCRLRRPRTGRFTPAAHPKPDRHPPPRHKAPHTLRTAPARQRGWYRTLSVRACSVLAMISLMPAPRLVGPKPSATLAQNAAMAYTTGAACSRQAAFSCTASVSASRAWQGRVGRRGWAHKDTDASVSSSQATGAPACCAPISFFALRRCASRVQGPVHAQLQAGGPPRPRLTLRVVIVAWNFI